MTRGFQQRLARRLAAARLYGASHPDAPLEQVWQQYGLPLVAQRREEWPARLAAIPAVYRAVIRSRLIRDYGETAEDSA